MMAFVEGTQQSVMKSVAWAVFVVTSILVTSGAIKFLPWDVMIFSLRNPNCLANAVWVWFAGSLLLFLFVNALWFLATALFPEKNISAGMIFTTFWALSVAVLILLLIFSLPGKVAPEFGVFSAIAGGVLGWLLGIGLTPESTAERQTFANIQTRIVASIAGIAGISLRSGWDWFADVHHKAYRMYLAFTLLSALVSLAAVYINRQTGRKVVKISSPVGTARDPKDKQCVLTKKTVSTPFTAAVSGLADTSVLWELLPGASGATQGAVVPNGCFRASVAGNYMVSARSNCDPSLVDVVRIRVID